MKASCTKCKQEKDLNTNNFYYRLKDKRWWRQCIICVSNHKKNKYKQNAIAIKDKAKIYRDLHREEIKIKAQIYNGRQDVKDRNKIWRQNNKKKLREKERLWRLKNPDKNKIIANRKAKKQRLNPSFKIRAHISRQINFALHKCNRSKDGYSVLTYLPYTIQELKDYLESKFEFWMNWENYGKYSSKTWKDDDISTWTWQIDHIIPQSDLPYLSMEDDNFKICWSLNNLRPLSSKINIIDGSNKIRHRKL